MASRKLWTLMNLGIIVVWLLFFQFVQLSEALAREESSSLTFGGTGGTRPYNLDCGSGGVLIGVASKGYATTEQMIIHCRAMNANGTLSEEQYTKGPVGGMGGDFLNGSRDCQADQVVTGIQVTTERFVNIIEFLCETWDSSRKEPIFENSPTRIRIGINCVGCKRHRTFHCPRGKVAKVLKGRSGIYIDSVRLVCDDWDK